MTDVQVPDITMPLPAIPGLPSPQLPSTRRPPAAKPGAPAAMRRHWDVLGSASSLVATTGVASLLGFVYWALAARLFSPRAVGYGSAGISAMTLLGTIGMLGLGTVLIGELPRRQDRAGLVAAALLASAAGSALLGAGFAIASPHISVHFGHISGSLGQAALFTAGVLPDRRVPGVRPGDDRAAAGRRPAGPQRGLRGGQARRAARYRARPA